MTTDKLTAFAKAKINLTLHITGQREDGYHLLDSLVVFGDIGDGIDFTPGPHMSIDVTGAFARGVPTDRSNLIWKAANKAGWTGHIDLRKNLPHGAGIGSGSADAAATLRTLGGEDHALELGADVPVCLDPVASHMRGIGEDITRLGYAPPGFWMVLVNPGVKLPTKQVFARLASKQNPAMDPLPGAGAGMAEWGRWLKAQRNDLETPAITIAPQIGEVLEALRACEHTYLARMSGSGATCFALTHNNHTARQVLKQVKADHPDWWCAITPFR